ncbi:MAG: class I SAM-dependent methyltransferase [Bryobacteraceae bacterium]
MHSSNELQAIYDRRFNAHIAYRQKVWQVLVADYFSKFVPQNGSILDLGCGYGEFINHVVCKQKYGMDLNTRARERLNRDVNFIEQDCSHPWPLPNNSLDVVFTSNFFEHLPSKEVLAQTLMQAQRCLKPGGKIIALGPNIRFVGGAYWDFWDHHLALTDSSLAEVMQVQGLQVERVIDRFLPYTMVNQRTVPSLLVRLYLKMPFLWQFLGKQFLVIGRKIDSERSPVHG